MTILLDCKIDISADVSINKTRFRNHKIFLRKYLLLKYFDMPIVADFWGEKHMSAKLIVK